MSRSRWAAVVLSAVFFLVLTAVYVRWGMGGALAERSFVFDERVYRLSEPQWLGLVLVVPGVFAMTAFSLTDLHWVQRLGSALTRSAFLVALALSLAQPVRTEKTQEVCAVVLVDVSSSVTEASLGDANRWLERAWSNKGSAEAFKVISFARRPRVVTASGDKGGAPVVVRHRGGSAEGVAAPDPGAESNLQAALQLSYGLYPPGCLRRAVLLSDGQQTRGDLLAEAGRAARFGVRLDAVVYERPAPAEVAISALRLPASVKVGTPFEVKATIISNRAMSAKVKLFQGQMLNGLDGLRKVDLVEGDNEVRFESVVRVPGEVTYRLELSELSADRFEDNNRFEASVSVPGRPQVLYVDGAVHRATPLARALTAQQYDVDLRSVAGFPSTLAELEPFDFVILSDVSRRAFGDERQRVIERYVRDRGGGFLFAGGTHGYALGGWQRSRLAELLPVRMEGNKRREMPSVAMALVIDRSGSMTGLPMEMAKKAAKATLGVLAADDLIEVVAFDSRPHRFVKMQPARNRSRIRHLISRIRPGGGTEIFSALDAAYNDLSVTQARRKHVILLTDGKAPSAGLRDLVTAMVSDSMTVTTVGLGGDVDEPVLKMIAEVGGGRFHAVPDPERLPRIFTKETQMVTQSAAIEEWFPVEQVGAARFLRGLDVRSAPLLHGYVTTEMKPSPAVEILRSADTQDPILARWRVGTGWALAWTSDLKSRWAAEWTAWPLFGKFWGKLVREHMRLDSERLLPMEATVRGEEVHVVVSALTRSDRFDNQLSSTVRITGPLPGNKSQEVTLRQTGPGRYEAKARLGGFGSFALEATHKRETDQGRDKVVARSRATVSHPYPGEYRRLGSNQKLLRGASQLTGGRLGLEPKDVFRPGPRSIERVRTLWPTCLMIALALFLLDLLLRRVRLVDRRFKTPRPA